MTIEQNKEQMNKNIEISNKDILNYFNSLKNQDTKKILDENNDWNFDFDEQWKALIEIQKKSETFEEIYKWVLKFKEENTKNIQKDESWFSSIWENLINLWKNLLDDTTENYRYLETIYKLEKSKLNETDENYLWSLLKESQLILNWSKDISEEVNEEVENKYYSIEKIINNLIEAESEIIPENVKNNLNKKVSEIFELKEKYNIKEKWIWKWINTIWADNKDAIIMYKEANEMSKDEAKKALQYTNSYYKEISKRDTETSISKTNLLNIDWQSDLNNFQNELIKIILWENGFNNEYIYWYNDDLWNYIIKIDQFEELTRQQNNAKEINAKALSIYFNYLDNAWKLNLEYLKTKLWKNVVKWIWEIWNKIKENTKNKNFFEKLINGDWKTLAQKNVWEKLEKEIIYFSKIFDMNLEDREKEINKLDDKKIEKLKKYLEKNPEKAIKNINDNNWACPIKEWEKNKNADIFIYSYWIKNNEEIKHIKNNLKNTFIDKLWCSEEKFNELIKELNEELNKSKPCWVNIIKRINTFIIKNNLNIDKIEWNILELTDKLLDSKKEEYNKIWNKLVEEERKAINENDKEKLKEIEKLKEELLKRTKNIDNTRVRINLLNKEWVEKITNSENINPNEIYKLAIEWNKKAQEILKNIKIENEAINKILDKYEVFWNIIKKYNLLFEQRDYSKEEINSFLNNIDYFTLEISKRRNLLNKEELEILENLELISKVRNSKEKVINKYDTKYLETLNKYNKYFENELEKDKTNNNEKNKTKTINYNSKNDYYFNNNKNIYQYKEWKINLWNNKEIKLNAFEQNLVKSNPESLENIIKFYNILEEVWLEKLWNIKESIFSSISNIEWVWFSLDWWYLNDNETKIFLNSILKSVWEEEISNIFTIKNFIEQFENKNWTQSWWKEAETSMHWEDKVTKIEGKFLNTYFPIWNTLWFKRSLFEESLKK